jgi:hypothetical protein
MTRPCAKAALAAALLCALPNGAAAGFPGLPKLPVPISRDEVTRTAADRLLDQARSKLPGPVAEALPNDARPLSGSADSRAEPDPAPAAPAASLVPTGFTPIGTFGEFRFDGVRTGTHKNIPVRFVDFTLKNTSDVTTFADTIQSVRWQGRTSGERVRALRPDGSPFGMHGQYVRPGEIVRVTYPIPDREDVDGVTVEYDHPGDGPRKRVWTWDGLATAAPQ